MEEWVWEGSFDNGGNIQNDYDSSEFGYDGNEIFELMNVDSTIRAKFEIESYDLVSNILEVEEGFSVTIDLFTTYVEDGTQVPFTIFGKDIDLNDFEGLPSLNGSFQVFDNKSSLSFNIKSDDIEEKYEFFTLLLNNNKSSVTIKIKGEYIPDPLNPNFEISMSENDDSVPYILSISSNSINESEILSISLSLKQNFLDSWVSQGTTIEGIQVAYNIINFNGIPSEDFLDGNDDNVLFPSSGFFTLDSDGNSSLSIKIAEDGVSEGSEKFRFSLSNYSQTFVEFIVKDEKYELKMDLDHPYDSGIISIKLETENLPDGTQVPFTIFVLGDYENSHDFNNSNLTIDDDGNFRGFFTVNDNYSLFDLNIRKDYFTENTESYILILDNEQDSLPITIQDTSQFFPDYTTYEYSIDFLSGDLPKDFSVKSEIVEIDKEFYLEIKFEGNTGNMRDYIEEYKLPDNFSYDKFNTADTFYQYGLLAELSGGNYTHLLNQINNFDINFDITVKIYSKTLDGQNIDYREDVKNFNLQIIRNYSSTRNQFLKEYLEERRRVDGEAYFHHKGVDYDNFEDYMKTLVEDLGFSFYE